MTLAEYLATAPSLEDARGRWLLMSPELTDIVAAKQSGLNSRHQVSPVPMTDGRLGLRADVLTEIGSDGIFRPLFALLDAARFAEVEILDEPDAIALLPQPDSNP